MAKALRKLEARLAREALRESAMAGKTWIVSKKLILEAEDLDGDMVDIELEKGETVDVGATDDGDLALDTQAAVVVISDADLAEKIAEIVVNSDELSDVKFVDKPAIDAVMDGEETDAVIDKLADTEGDAEEVDVAEVEVEAKESVEAKFAKFSENRIRADKYMICESILVDDEDEAPINMATIKVRGAKKESFMDYKKFAARVSELHGSLQPGKREIALNEAGEVMGAYDTEADNGVIYPENSFTEVDAMDNFDAEPVDLMQDFEPEVEEDAVDFEADEVLESALSKFEESAKTGKDYMELVDGLKGFKESTIAKVVATFDNKSLKECVRCFDSKYGKYVAAFKESTDCNNFIAETGDEKRFTKRFFG